jgi:hypothetical protein
MISASRVTPFERARILHDEELLCQVPNKEEFTMAPSFLQHNPNDCTRSGEEWSCVVPLVPAEKGTPTLLPPLSVFWKTRSLLYSRVQLFMEQCAYL